MPDLNLYVILPTVLLTVWACALLLLRSVHQAQGNHGPAGGGWTGAYPGPHVDRRPAATPPASPAWWSWTVFPHSLYVLFLLTGLFGVAVAYDYIRRTGIERGEYYVLMLFSVAGMMLMSQAIDLIVVFLALELLSIPLYVLAAFAHPRAESEEAGLKYFLLGAFAAGFLVYGIALVFGATGTTSLQAIVDSVNSGSANPTFLSGGRSACAGRVRVQGRGGSLPHVDAGCLPGRAHGGDGLHVSGSQGRRVCRAAARLRDCLPLPVRGPGARPVRLSRR